jgi:ADP-ribose pyrophosphatase YjhB (NUDIX family)
VYLGSSQTHALILGHGLYQVVNEPLNDGALDISSIDGARLSAEHGVPHSRDFENSHNTGIILVARVSDLLHDKSSGYRFCPRCGGALERRRLKPGEPERLVCTRCAFVFYLDPKIAVGTIIRSESRRLVLVRRAIDPGHGRWVFPGGFVDLGERLTVAAVREAREECGLDVRLDGLVNIYSYAGRNPVIVVYAATATGGRLCADDECLEAAEFDQAEIPWNDLAFRSTHEGLRDYLAGLLHPVSR